MTNEIFSILESFGRLIEDYWPYLSVLLVIFFAVIRKDIVLFTKRFFNQSSRKYYKEILNRLKNEENYDSFPNLKLQAKSLTDSEQNLSLPDLIKSESAIHIQGKPGSGKTSLIKKYIISQCEYNIFFKPKYIPVYIKYSGEDLFTEILSSLIERDYINDPSHFDIDWIIKTLKRNRFLIIIDDIHNLISDEDKRSKSKIDKLIKFNNNKFILVSRDYYSACPFHLKIYEIEDLSNNRELAEQILKLHSEKDKFQRIWMHLSYGYKEELLQLYNTPQLIKLLAKVFDQKDHFDDTKSFLFKRFLNSRHEEEVINHSEVLPINFKQKVLSSVAYQLFIQRGVSGYSTSYNVFRETLNTCVREIKEKLGYSDHSVDSIIEGLKEEGYIVQIDEKVQFEHDQWQEFFTALFIFHEEKSIKPFLSTNFGNEIALFVSGLYQLENELIKKKFWGQFWEELAVSDFFLTKWCLDNRVNSSIAEIQKIYKNYTFNDEEFFNAYESMLTWYLKIITFHFPNLSLKFTPSGTNDVGILVEQNKNKVGQDYSYRPITEKNSERVIVTDQNNIMNLNNSTDPRDNFNYYHMHYDIDYMQSYIGTSAVHSHPVVLAYRDVLNQVSKFVRKGNLVETKMMQEEALYNESVSLSKILKGRRSEITNPSKQYVLTVGQLLEGIEKIKADDFNRLIKVPGSTLRHYELPDRKINIHDFELRFKKLISVNRLSPTTKLISPNSDLIEVLRNYRFNKDELTSEHKNFLIKRSIEFYTDVYQNYKRVLELNFPTSISHFRSTFPVQIFLIKKGKQEKRFGEKVIFYGVRDLVDPINVKIIDEKDEEKLKSKYKGYYGVGSYWGLTSFSMLEPVRNSVYQLIKNEYEQLIRRTNHRV